MLTLANNMISTRLPRSTVKTLTLLTYTMSSQQ